MMRTFLFLALLLISLSASANSPEMIFREDMGLSKAEYLLAAGKFSAALDTANDVLKRHPDSADAYTYRGYAYYKLGEKAEAAKNFQLALKLNPTHLGANKYLADTYLDNGDVARALEQLQVIRLTCGRADCEELNALQRQIDRYKRAPNNSDAGAEEQNQ